MNEFAKKFKDDVDKAIEILDRHVSCKSIIDMDYDDLMMSKALLDLIHSATDLVAEQSRMMEETSEKVSELLELIKKEQES